MQLHYFTHVKYICFLISTSLLQFTEEKNNELNFISKLEYIFCA